MVIPGLLRALPVGGQLKEEQIGQKAQLDRQLQTRLGTAPDGKARDTRQWPEQFIHALALTSIFMAFPKLCCCPNPDFLLIDSGYFVSRFQNMVTYFQGRDWEMRNESNKDKKKKRRGRGE